MDKKKKRDLNISIIGSGLLSKGSMILFLYCLIAGLIWNHLPLIAIGGLFVIVGFEYLIICNTYRIKKLELQQKGEW